MKTFFYSKAGILYAIMIVVLCITFPHISMAQCGKLNYSADGPVFSSAYDSSRNLLYIGGFFDKINPFKSQGAYFDSGFTELDRKWPVVDYGDIYSIVSDSQGGYYIGGSFGTVGDSLRPRLAHIDSNGKVTKWNPRANYTVYKIIVSGNTVFIGGAFTAIGGISRNFIGAVDRYTGKLTAWNPNSNSGVECMDLNNGVLYVGGSFTNIGGSARNRLAAIDTGTGLARAWNPNSDGKVKKLICVGKNVYAAGDFTKIGSISRRYLAAIDTNSSIANTWNPALTIGNYVEAFAKRDSILYIGGSFSLIAGMARKNAAALNTNTNVLTSWNPMPDNVLTCILASEKSIYISGEFYSVGDSIRYGLAEVNDSNGIVNKRAMNAGAVYSMEVYKGCLFLGNIGRYIGGYRCHNIAAIDLTTGIPMDWNPNPDNGVLAIALKGNKIYIGGYFGNVGGKKRNRLAELTTGSNEATKWNPRAGVNGSEVLTLLIADSLLYVGGKFDSLGGKYHRNIGAVSLATGIVKSWNPGTNAEVRSMIHKDSSLFISGFFTIVNSLSRTFIAEISINTGALTSWNPGADGAVIDMTRLDNTLYIGGNFNQVSGVSRNHIAALNMKTGAATSWNPGADNTVVCLTNDGKNIYAGGYFTKTGNKNRNRLAALDVTTGTPTSMDPNLDAYPETIVQAGNALFFGGHFTTQINQPYNHFGGLTIEPVCLKPLAGTNNTCIGSNAELSVAARYADTYQWQISTNGGSSWNNALDTGNYSGSKTNKLIIFKTPSSFNNYRYRCIITGCKRDTGIAGTLKVNALPVINNTIPDSRCGPGTLLLQVVTSASKVIWYDTAKAGKRLDSMAVFTTPYLSMDKEYYVEATDLGCISARVPVKANIDTMPLLKVQNDTVYRCGTGQLKLKALADRGKVNWYISSTGGGILLQDSIFTTPVLSQNSVYFAGAVNGTCTTARTAVTAVPKQINTAVSVSTNTITAGQINAQYKWINCFDGSIIAGANQRQYTATLSGKYAVEVTYNGCTDTSTCTYVLGTSVEEIDFAQKFSLFPNPASNLFQIKSSINGVCVITSITGQIVAEYILNEVNGREVSVSNLISGVYYITFSDDNYSCTKRLVLLK